MKYSEGSGDDSRVSEPRAIYVPIFDSFFESSIMREDLAVRFVMLALIRLAWRPRSNGIVDVDPWMFAQSINVPYDEVQRALIRLMDPDPNSGSKLEEGRRIVPLDWSSPMRGWRVVNWVGYKKLLNKANDKVRKANERANADIPDSSDKTAMSLTIRDDTIRNETTKRDIVHTKVSDSDFDEWWKRYPRKVGKGAAQKAWRSMSSANRKAAQDAVGGFAAAWAKAAPDQRQYCPHATTWLNRAGWEDDPAEWARSAGTDEDDDAPRNVLSANPREEEEDRKIKDELADELRSRGMLPAKS